MGKGFLFLCVLLMASPRGLAEVMTVKVPGAPVYFKSDPDSNRLVSLPLGASVETIGKPKGEFQKVKFKLFKGRAKMQGYVPLKDLEAGTHDPCRNDARKFCAGVAPGKALDSCLQAHLNAVSFDCNTKMNFCSSELQKFCGDKKSKNDFWECAFSKKARFSKHCQNTMLACADYKTRFCPSEPFGPDYRKCMLRHENEISATCVRSLMPQK